MANDNEAATNALRAEIESWLARHWDPSLSVDEWWRVVAEAGWTAPHLTLEQGGRGLHRTAVNTVRAEFSRFGALRPPGGLGLLMAAPTMLTHGTPEQIARLVPPILQGRVNWCQLFSEPGAGSDLAGLTTRAERDGDRWIINGQKVWSSMAMQADYGMLLARTDFSVPKHNGISWFAFKLDQPGVTAVKLVTLLGTSLAGVGMARSHLDRGTRGGGLERLVFDRLRQLRLFGLPDWKAESTRWARWAGAWPAARVRAGLRAARDADVALKSTTISDERAILVDLVLRLSVRQAEAA